MIFLTILWRSQNDNHLWENLVKFGHKQDTKAKKIQAYLFIYGYLMEWNMTLTIFNFIFIFWNLPIENLKHYFIFTFQLLL